MAAVKPPTQNRLQRTTFALEGRPMSSESLDTTRRKFLNAPLLDPLEDDSALSKSVQASNGPGDKKKKRKKKQSKKAAFDPNKDDREEQRLKELKEKHMRVLDDLAKLKAHYYLEYMEALTDKVEEQRTEIQRKSEIQRRKLIRREKKEKEAAKKAKILMHRPEVSSDNAFIRGLPKTTYHKIVVLQDQLIREGKLRRDEDMRAFWEDIGRPENYSKLFEDDTGDVGTNIKTKPRGHKGEMYSGEVESQDSDSIPETKSASSGSLLQQSYLGLIEEVKEPSRPSSMGGPNVQSWINAPKLKKKIAQTLLTRKPVHPKVLEMEQKCPRVEFPTLAAFTLDLEPPKEDPEVELMREEFKSRARIRNAEVRRLRKMYQTSLSHGAATKRIFAKKDEFSDLLNGPALRDVVFSHDRVDHLALVRREEEDEEEEEERLALPPPEIITTTHGGNGRNATTTGGNPGRSIRSFAIERISEEGDVEDDDDDDELGDEEKRFVTYSSRSSSRRSSLTSTESEKRRNTPVTPDPRQPHPLTIDAVLEQSEVKVVNCPSTLWVNYGKFLPSAR